MGEPRGGVVGNALAYTQIPKGFTTPRKKSNSQLFVAELFFVEGLVGQTQS